MALRLLALPMTFLMIKCLHSLHVALLKPLVLQISSTCLTASTATTSSSSSSLFSGTKEYASCFSLGRMLYAWSMCCPQSTHDDMFMNLAIVLIFGGSRKALSVR